MYLKMAAAKWRPFCPGGGGGYELIHEPTWQDSCALVSRAKFSAILWTVIELQHDRIGWPDNEQKL